jgi:hypothetical protein
VRDRLKSKYYLLLAGVICSVTIPMQIAPSCAQPPAKTSVKTAKKAKPPQSSLPQTNTLTASEGVQLIEEIFDKLKNVPVIAVANAKQLLAYQNQSAQQQQAWGSADSNLMIKPAQSNAPRAMPVASYSGAADKGLTVANKPAAPSASGARWRFQPQTITAPASNSETSQLEVAANTRSQTVWEKKGRVQTQSSSQMLADNELDSLRQEGARDAKNITTYGGRADAAGNVLSSAPLIREFAKDQLASAGGKATLNGTLLQAQGTKAKVAQVDLDDALRRANSPQFNKLAKSLSGANLPDVCVQVQASVGRQKSQLKTAAGYAPGAGGLVPPPPPQFITMGGAPTSALSSEGPADMMAPQTFDARLQFSAKKSAMRATQARGAVMKEERDEIALLPITKFSGIPLVSLGDSEAELSKRLGDVGVVEITVLKPWTVWSVKKRGSQECSLQVFTQRGVVEAVRVKDKSVWTNQQGIGLGDEVSIVKEKFGEPAFIISHLPIKPSAPKVYVYPISQVAFRLEKTANADAPHIKDIIIFNVK